MRVTLLSCLAAATCLSWACGSDFQASDGGGGTASGTGGTGTSSSTSGQAGDGGTTSGGGSSSGSPCDEPLQFVPAVPADWEGPILLGIHNSPGVPDCPDNTTGQGVVMSGLEAPAFACDCNCSAPKSEECSASFEMFDAAGCGGTKVFGTTINHNACVSFSGSFVVESINWSPSGAPASVCDATPANHPQTPPSWDHYARVCLMEWASCMEPPPSSFEDTYCVHKAGQQSCPTGAYSVHSVFYTEVDDQRGCADDCACNPAGVDCAGQLKAYPQPSCQSPMEPQWLNAGCTASVNAAPQSGHYSAQPAGSCVPQQATPIGEANPAGPFTVCCLPGGAVSP